MVSEWAVSRWLSGVMAIALLSSSASILFPISGRGWAQTPPVDCANERQERIRAALAGLENELNRELSRQDFRQVGQTYTAFFEQAGQLDEADRTAFLALFLLEESGQQHAQWRRWVEYEVTAQDSGAIASTLNTALTTAQSLSTAHSFNKTRILTALARTYAELGDTESAEAVLRQALQASRTIQGAEFQTNALTPLAEAYLQVGQIEPALAILRQARAAAEQVNHPVYPTRRGQALGQVAIAYGKADQIEPALELIGEIENDTESQGRALQAVTDAYIRAGERSAALETARRIGSPALEAGAIASVAKYDVSQNDLEQAAMLFSEAGRLAETDSSVLNRVMADYANIRPDAALDLARSLPIPEQRLSALAYVALAYAQTNRSAEANAVVDDMITTAQQIPEDWQGFEIVRLVDQAIAAQAYDQAIRLALVPDQASPYYSRERVLADIARRAAEKNDEAVVTQAIAAINPANVEARANALQAVAIVYVQANQVDRALELVNQMDATSSGYRVRILAAIAGEVYRIGGIDPATPLFNQALQQAETLTQPEEKVIALAAIALAYSRTGQITQAQEMATQIASTVPNFVDTFTASSVLQKVVEEASGLDQHALALQLIQLMPEENARNYTLYSAIDQAIDAEQYGIVLPLLEGIEPPETQAQIQLRISDRYRAAGETSEALRILAQALEATRRVADPESRVLVFGNEGGTVVEDSSDRASLLEEIALRYEWLGQSEQARQVSGLIQEAAARDRVSQRLRCW